MIKDLVYIFPRERLKELFLSSLEETEGEDIITVRDQMFSIVLMSETIRN